jgi:hypothetical protein
MFTRRFVFLVGVLGALNLALFFAAPGLALRKALINELFGPKMMRVEVVWKNGADWRVARGVIKSVDSTQVTLREGDGKIEQVQLATATRVIRFGRPLPLSALAPRWHVVVTWPANSPAQSVDVEKVPPRRPAGIG